MIGLEVAQVSGLVAAQTGGSVDERSRYEHVVAGDPAGEWKVELDYAYLKKKGREDTNGDNGLARLNEAAENIVRAGAELIVPVEVVTPPLPLPRLAEVESLISRLRDAGARGTEAGVAYAFGIQFNPELPALDAGTITRYLQAFFCLFDWLAQQSQVDPTRKLTRYTADFPSSYVRKVIDPDYRPALEALIDDYLDENPTRNRALDMLPLFMYLDEDRLRAVVSDERVKPRPTLHYRLPNCEIDREDWGVHVPWGDWLQVEYLAADDKKLRFVCERYAEVLDRLLPRMFTNWVDEVEQWLKPADEL